MTKSFTKLWILCVFLIVLVPGCYIRTIEYKWVVKRQIPNPQLGITFEFIDRGYGKSAKGDLILQITPPEKVYKVILDSISLGKLRIKAGALKRKRIRYYDIYRFDNVRVEHPEMSKELILWGFCVSQTDTIPFVETLTIKRNKKGKWFEPFTV